MTKRKRRVLPEKEQPLPVGDKVVHPAHGVGEIIAIRDQELVEGFEHYYVIEIPENRLTLNIPVSKLTEVGVRTLMPPAELPQVFDTLSGSPTALSADFSDRQDKIRNMLDTGQPLKVAEAVRDLTWHKHQAHLTKADSDLLERGQTLLINEIAAVTNASNLSVKQEIQSILQDALPAISTSE